MVNDRMRGSDETGTIWQGVVDPYIYIYIYIYIYETLHSYLLGRSEEK